MNFPKLITPSQFTNALSSEQVQSWREHGFLLVDNLLEPHLLKNAVSTLDKLHPKCTPEEMKILSHGQDFGSNGIMEFPSQYDSLNQITLSPNIVSSVKTLLGTGGNNNNKNNNKEDEDDSIRLIQSDAWVKYGYSDKSKNKFNNRDQRIHMDYPNNYLTHPPSWYNPQSVAIIIYYDQYEEVGGSTALVPRTGKNDPAYVYPYVKTPGVAGMPWINDRESAEKYMEENHPEIFEFRKKLYEREVKGNYNVGTVLFYRHDIWHRGTPVNDFQVRRVQNIGFRKKDCEWVTTWNKGWARDLAFKGQIEYLYAGMSVTQRNCLGFPKPGHSYWDEETLHAMQQRYAPYGFDITPYRDAYDAKTQIKTNK